MQRRRLAGVLAIAFAAAAATAIACGDAHDVADGDECSSSGDCVSNLCVSGKCAGKQCSCAGAGCPDSGPCDDGWRCSARNADIGLRCLRTCAAERPCPSGETCDDGLCVPASAATPTLAWVTRPGDQRCALAQRCVYAVRIEGNAGRVRSFKWDFGDDAGVEESDGGEIGHLFPTPGTYRVEVRADVEGTNVQPGLDAYEHVCIVDESIDCRPTPDDCCAGTCTLSGQCR